MARDPLTIEQVLAILSVTPGRIAAATAGLAPADLRATPADGGWSAVEVLAHLRSCADVWGGCIQRILSEDHPTLRAMDPRTWTERTDYRALEFAPSLDAFTAQRAELLAILAALDAAAWSRAATVTGAGRPLERTVHGYAQWLARHERPHVRQLERVVAELRARP